MTEVNVPLLRKAVEWVEEQNNLPIETRQWMQQVYVLREDVRVDGYAHQRGCGTAFCLAGYVAAMVEPRLAEKDFYVDENGEYVYTADVAEKLLGLPEDHILFLANNSAETIRELAERYAGEKL